MLPAHWLETAQLWLVLDEAAAQPRSLAQATSLAIEGGIDAVVFRHKRRSLTDVLKLGREVRAVCKDSGVPFVLSHYFNLVGELDPDAVHLGNEDQEAENLKTVRSSFAGPVGFSCHSLLEVRQRSRQGYDYCFFGPIFDTPSKRGMGQPQGPDTAQLAQAATLKPLVLIGGVSVANLGELSVDCPLRVAVISAILSAPDPTVAARELWNVLSERNRVA